MELLNGKGFEITQRFVLDAESLEVLVNRCSNLNRCASHSVSLTVCRSAGNEAGGALLRTEAPSACTYFKVNDQNASLTISR